MVHMELHVGDISLAMLDGLLAGVSNPGSHSALQSAAMAVPNMH